MRISTCLLVCVLTACCGGPEPEDQLQKLRREISVKNEAVMQMKNRLSDTELRIEQVRLAGKQVEQQNALGAEELISLYGLSSWVFKATNSRALAHLKTRERERIYYNSIIAAIADTGDSSLSGELAQFLQDRRSCYEIEGDGADCGCDAFLEPECRHMATHLDHTPAFGSCEHRVSFPGAPTSVACVSSGRGWFRTAFAHQGRVVVTDYPAPAAKHYYPENRHGIAFCLMLADVDKCEKRCLGEVTTYEECEDDCMEAWNRMHSGFLDGEPEEDEEDRPSDEMIDACMKSCRWEFDQEYPEGDDFDPYSFIDEIRIDKVHTPAPGIYVLELIRAEGWLRRGDREAKVVVWSHTVMLRDRNLAALWKCEGIDPEKLDQEHGILEQFEVLLDVVDDRPIDQNSLDYPTRPHILPRIPVRFVELDPPGRVLMVDGPTVRIFGFSGVQGQPAIRDIPIEEFCQVVRQKKLKLSEPFEAFCEQAGEVEP